MSLKRRKVTVAGCAPQRFAGHRLEPTSRACYAAMLKHVVKGLGGVDSWLDALDRAMAA